MSAEQKSVFAVYAPRDRKTVSPVLKQLKKKDIRILEAGGLFGESAETLLKAADAMLLFLSEAFSADAECMKTLRTVLTEDRPYGIVRLDDHELDPNYEMYLRSVQDLRMSSFPDCESLVGEILRAEAFRTGAGGAGWNGNGKFLFISYAHAETELIEAVAAEFSKRNLNFWYDKDLNLGDPWKKQIAQRISASRVFLAFVSNAYTKSKNCSAELEWAAGRSGTLMSAIMLHGAKLDEGIDMYVRSGGAVLYYEHYKTVAALVDALLEQAGVAECRAVKQAPKASAAKPATAEKALPASALRLDGNLVFFFPGEEESPKKKQKPLKRAGVKELMAKGSRIAAMDFPIGAPASMMEKLRQRAGLGESLEELLPDTFRTVAAAARLAEDAILENVRMACGIALHEENVVEILDSDDRKVVCLLAACLNALKGDGVHIITLDDFYTKQFEDRLRPICDTLGMSLGAVYRDTKRPDRKAAYAAEITIVSHSNLSRDYLRDHAAMNVKDTVLRGLAYAIVDEADAVLLDNALASTVLSKDKNGASSDQSLCHACDMLVLRLKPSRDGERDGDFYMENGIVNYTPSGMQMISRHFGITMEDHYLENMRLEDAMATAVKAHFSMKKGRDYIISDDKIMPLDPKTGMVMPYSTYSDGMQQALEYKECLPVTTPKEKAAEISLRNLINLYRKKAGISRSAAGDKDEILHYYGLPVVTTPSLTPRLREDLPDRIFATRETKLLNIAEAALGTDRPVIIGTPDLDELNELGKRLSKDRMKPVYILQPGTPYDTARDILRDAGKPYRITLVSGTYLRGMDIRIDPDTNASGGLYVIGASHFESSRADDQLRGVSGRQGEPGTAVFYTSMEDEYMVRLIPEKQRLYVRDLGSYQDYSSKLLNKSIAKTAEKARIYNASLRGLSVGFNTVDDAHAFRLYRDRERILTAEDTRGLFLTILRVWVSGTIDSFGDDGKIRTAEELEERTEAFRPYFLPERVPFPGGPQKPVTAEELRKECTACLEEAFEEKMRSFDLKADELLRQIMLRVMDDQWASHLNYRGKLRERGKSLEEDTVCLENYRADAGQQFRVFRDTCMEKIVETVFRVHVQKPVAAADSGAPTYTSAYRPRGMNKRVYPNDPCPCGSGKKYKQCHGRLGSTKDFPSDR